MSYTEKLFERWVLILHREYYEHILSLLTQLFLEEYHASMRFISLYNLTQVIQTLYYTGNIKSCLNSQL